MFQVFHLDVAKVDLDVAYTCILQAYVFERFSVASNVCFMCFVWMLHIFCNGYTCFFGVSDICCKCFSYFGHILQVFYLNITKVDPVLHMLQWNPPAAST
jgi:hypothetical protein